MAFAEFQPDGICWFSALRHCCMVFSLMALLFFSLMALLVFSLMAFAEFQPDGIDEFTNTMQKYQRFNSP
jgi:hypothetical protein